MVLLYGLCSKHSSPVQVSASSGTDVSSNKHVHPYNADCTFVYVSLNLQMDDTFQHNSTLSDFRRIFSAAVDLYHPHRRNVGWNGRN
jgi:hypothetical protein